MKFAYIQTIDDVLPHLEGPGKDDFIVAERDGHTIINYNVMTSDTFPDLEIEEYCVGPGSPMYWEYKKARYGRMVRRECRGIIFDAAGKIIRRPLEKFFNLGEREETRHENLNWVKDGIEVYDKMDGSMIAPYMVNGEIIWGTKMGDTDIAKQVKEFAENHDYIRYGSFVEECFRFGYTPIFEYTAPSNRIVLAYEEESLTLLAIRSMQSGEYRPRQILEFVERDFAIPIVRKFELGDNIPSISEHIKGLENTEGVIIASKCGSHKVKVKCDWYLRLHKTLEKVNLEKDIISVIVNNELDDVKAFLPKEKVARIEAFADDLISSVNREINALAVDFAELYSMPVPYSRKDFALAIKDYGPAQKFMFKLLDKQAGPDAEKVKEILKPMVYDHIANSLQSQSKVDSIRWLIGVNWEDY